MTGVQTCALPISHEFEVDLQWRVAKAGGNKALTLTLVEQKEYSKILDNENGFPWTLVQDRDEVEKYWSNFRLVSPVGLVSLLMVLFKL